MPIESVCHHGDLPLIVKGPTRSRGKLGELDSLTLEVITRAGHVVEDLASLGYVMFQKKDGYHAMYLEPFEDEDENDLVTKVSLRCVGLIDSGEKRRRRTSTNSKEISLGPSEGVIYSTPDGTADRWSIKDAVLVVKDTYFTATRPDTTIIGRNFIPPNPPDPPEYLDWFGIPVRYLSPKNWVLDDRQAELVAGTEEDGLWMVEDTTGYYQLANPDT